MKIKTIQLNNFRSIQNLYLSFGDYSLLLGENNAGKTSVFTALRIFYEEGGAKFSSNNDFPKFVTDDKESWLEIHYATTEDEQDQLKAEYRSDDGVLQVRRYFQSEDKDRVKQNQSNIYAFEGGELSESLFYGAKNIGQAKLGKLIYIPEVAKTDDSLKVSGPSPFRDMMNFVMKRAVLQSQSFSKLSESFDVFNSNFKQEASADGFSVNAVVDAINQEFENWRIHFGVEVNPLKPEDIVKTLMHHYIEDENLGGERVSISSYGQGLQRHLIYTLIRLSAQLTAPSTTSRKDFSPDFTLILFEEPEAFLHPSQQDRLNSSLRALAAGESQQVFVTTHSPKFVSRQINDLPSLIRLHKPQAQTRSYQIMHEELDALLDENTGLLRRFQEILENPESSETLIAEIREKELCGTGPIDDSKLLEEAIRYFLYLDSEKSAAFFAQLVLICEGASEAALLNFLSEQRWQDLKDRHVYFLDAMGKFNIHRYMGLFTRLGVAHAVLLDRDPNTEVQQVVNSFISDCATEFTQGIKFFPEDLEAFLGIEKPKRNDLKPLNVLSCLQNGIIGEDRIHELRNLVDSLISNPGAA